MIEEDLITYNTAVLAKSKGFDNTECYNYWYIPPTNIDLKGDDLLPQEGSSYINCQTNNYLLQPTQAVLAKWLRNVHKLAVFVDCTTYVPEGSELNNSYYWFITDVEYRNIYNVDNLESGYYDTYEQALEKGLQAALKLI